MPYNENLPPNPATNARSVFISDVHLGTRSCRAVTLLQFLRSLNTENLFLVGDIVDLERMEQSVYWPATHSAVIREIFRLVKNGVQVTYIPGNHDARARMLAGQTINGIGIRLNTIHETADGRRLLITHGDQFDSQLRIGSLKEKIGSVGYRLLMDVDVSLNRLRQRFGYKSLDLATAIKGRLKSVRRYIGEFEALASGHAKARGLDGIICGHIHKPCARVIDAMDYYNTGDWVEHGTAFIEDHDGRLRLITHGPGTETASAVATAA